jgi:branched-chain amino acid aminotransferase
MLAQSHDQVCLPQTMFVAEWQPENGWAPGELKPYGPLSMMPSAQVGGSAWQ